MVFGSKHSRSSRSAYVSGFWTKQGNKLDSLELPRLPRPGRVEYYFKQNILLQDQTKTVYLAKVDWYLETERLKDYYGKPVEVYRNNLFEQPGPAMFIPISRLKCKIVPVVTKLEGVDVVIALDIAKGRADGAGTRASRRWRHAQSRLTSRVIIIHQCQIQIGRAHV